MGVRKISYVDLKVPNRAGQAAQVLGALQKGGVSLSAITAFPDRGGKTQVDLVTKDLAGVRRVAKKEGWRISKAKKGFLIQGRDRVGAVVRHAKKLAQNRINITALNAAAAGKGVFGMMLWVKPKDYARAGRVLGAR
jgi:hypothetical protein